MAARFMRTMLTPPVLEAEQHYYGRNYPAFEDAPEQDPLGPGEIQFIESRDSFYMATVNEDGWPYIQHRGGPKGFAKVTGPDEITFADYRGNRQLISTGNLTGNDRVSLFLMDYPNRERLKILGRAETLDAREHPDIVKQVADPSLLKITERVFRIRVLTFDWNCPKYITPRYTATEWTTFTGI